MKSTNQIALILLLLTPMNQGSFAQSGIITTYVGPGYPVDGAVAITQAIDQPSSVALDGAGGFYVSSEFQNRVYRVTADGRLALVAGSRTAGFGGDGGKATSASLSGPKGIATDSAGNLFIADTLNNRIRKVTPGGIISTVAGIGPAGFGGDGGPATSAQLSGPVGITVDPGGNLYIADTSNSRIRKVTPAGIITTVAGSGTYGYSGDGGLAISAQVSYPNGVAVDTAGNLFIADTPIHRVRKVTPDGVIRTVAGNGAFGYAGDGRAATSAEMRFPSGLVIDSAGNLIISDTSNDRIRKVTTDGVINTIAG
ncbi:MAG TPA: hypothetical protein VE398_12240, partial [Acidobacteriota bacterium]|nr:hypothetical protein [Acidobacteriota bacterium]